MFSRTAKLLSLAAVFLFMSGCPPISGTVSLNPGHWSFEISGLVQPASIVLLSDGTTALVPGGPPAGSTNLNGAITWMQVDEVFTMQQTLMGGDVFEYTGTVFAATHMEGSYEQTVGGSEMGIWTANYIAP